ncbi:efflux transporter outer membrane subunit [Granulicella sp. 5B5]|uniref:efflux transporter outer membrane subunit n=1 Tax=Granulicella sp. 5B5 TaxID=1617967 RepID=UPI0015F38455|nr:efflux transporter outer membrane subunit [Granulicella sp. 5B5]QMV18510.1 efflux transporter outer membrane subunit [Granulicella sp. 5B5]
MNRSLPFIPAAALLLLTGCMVGPKYKRPAAIMTPSFKEAAGAGWRPGQPSDQTLKGNWWRMYQDPQLDALEAQVDDANQTLKIAAANFRAARAAIGFARSNEAPTVGVGASAGTVRESANQPYFLTNLANNGGGDFSSPIDLNYEIDLWGRIRRGVTSAREQAQASAADMESVRLSLHAELATDYFGLRSDDGQEKLLDDTIKAYTDALQLTHDRFDGGLALSSDVTQAEAQLDQARVQRTDAEVQRTQYEHAIAVLVGKPPAALTIPRSPIDIQAPQVPSIPAVVPSALLERRPDIAADERRMASANEQIGIAQAAYYPTLSLSGLAGMEGTSALNWFTWPSRFWAVGPSVSETIFDGGRRHAASNSARANYDAAVATYRQTTLQAFQQVEDNLAALRLLNTEREQQHRATAASLQSLDTFKARYEGGVELYLDVVVSQTEALGNQRNDIELMRRQLDASVLLIKALGGGWDVHQLPNL